LSCGLIRNRSIIQSSSLTVADDFEKFAQL
jgi:hypothetical protein